MALSDGQIAWFLVKWIWIPSVIVVGVIVIIALFRRILQAHLDRWKREDR